MDIIFNPPVNNENQYIRLIVDELNAKGYRIHALDNFFSSFRHFKSIRLVHLNWFENIDDSNFFAALKSFFRKMVVLMAIRLSGKPLIWTMHNRTSHEKGTAFFSRILVYFLLRWTRRIIIHTHQSEHMLATIDSKVARKAVYIPHPNFIGVYGDIISPVMPAAPQLQLLFMGMVKPYKNLEMLIGVVKQFHDDVQLVIAGRATDPVYRKQVAKQAASAGNVELRPYFIPDEELAGLIKKADVLVLPYDLTSSLNSGTAILAFSLKKTVICPEIGTITDLGMLQDRVFHYRYGNAAEHREALTNQIAGALLLKQENPLKLQEMGTRLYDHVEKVHDRRSVGIQLDHIYRALVRKK